MSTGAGADSLDKAAEGQAKGRDRTGNPPQEGEASLLAR
jgi:hypothetical protein